MTKRPAWLKVRAPNSEEAAGMREVRDLLAKHRINTVCQGAICPNAIECWGARTATFMILGDTCTRGCRFCGVPTGNPGGVADHSEPVRVASAVAELELRYVVLTSVDRDDLPDGGAEVFAETVRQIKTQCPKTVVEVLIPDFSGSEASLREILDSGADVLGHNLETVRRLTPEMRDHRATYDQSLEVLDFLSRVSDGRPTKSGIMLGLGESQTEVLEALGDLRSAGTSIVTLGQYLKPTDRSAEVAEYIVPEAFESLAQQGTAMGFAAVVAGPRVRSSFHAAEAYEDARAQ